MEKPPMINIPDAEFMERLHFSPVDLDFNRRGELSPDQLQRLKVEREYTQFATTQPDAGSSRLAMILFIVMLGGVFAFMWFMAGEQFKQIFESLGSWTIPAVLGLVLLGGLYLMYARRSIQESHRMYREMNASAAVKPMPEVKSVRGGAWTEGARKSQRSREYNYYVFVDNLTERQQIRISKNGHHAFARGTVYRVYYYEDSGAAVFLSAEVG